VKAYRKIQTRPDPEVLDRALGYVQDAVADFTGSLTFIPWLDGIALNGQQVTAAGVNLRHGLVDDRQKPRAFQGWWITRVVGAGYVYEPTSQPDAARYLKLQSSATVTVDLWVF